MSIDSVQDGNGTPAKVREISLRLQDLEAALYRAHHALGEARIEAGIHHGRSLDLEEDLRELNEQHLRDRQEIADAHRQIADAHQQMAVAQENLKQVLSAAAAERMRHESEELLWQTRLNEARLAASNTLQLLLDVLTSRSWVWTRPLRKLMEWSRGRRWREPQIPPLPSWVSGDGRRSAQDEDGRLRKQATETKA